MQIVQEDLFDNAGLGVICAVGAADPHPDFGRSVAAEDGPVVHEGDAGAAPRRGDGGAHARQTAADDAEVNLERFLPERTRSH